MVVSQEAAVKHLRWCEGVHVLARERGFMNAPALEGLGGAASGDLGQALRQAVVGRRGGGGVRTRQDVPAQAIECHSGGDRRAEGPDAGYG